MPAEAGIQGRWDGLDSRLRGNDDGGDSRFRFHEGQAFRGNDDLEVRLIY